VNNARRGFKIGVDNGATIRWDRARMLDFTGLNEVIGTPEMLALGK
jgi:hypothetical protein